LKYFWNNFEIFLKYFWNNFEIIFIFQIQSFYSSDRLNATKGLGLHNFQFEDSENLLDVYYHWC
jgi:hypothetical protein